MQDNGQTKNGKEFQRPVIMQQLGSSEITLHEDIMKDTWMTDTHVEEIHTNIEGNIGITLWYCIAAKLFIIISWTYFNTLLVISSWKYYRYMSAGLNTA